MGIRAASQSTVITSTEQRTHAGVKQRPLWENHSLNSSHFRKGSDQWRVSPSQCAMLRAEKLEFSRHMKPCVSWVLMPLAAWQASAKPIDGHQGSWFRHVVFTCFLPSSCPMRQRFANACNDTVVSRLPSQMSPTVGMTKFLSDAKESFTQAVLPKSFLFHLRVRKDWKISRSECSSHLSSLLDTVQNTGYQCRCQPVTTVRLWDNQRSEQ